ncbi:hypothetical protein IC006_2233 [Sulfuracidifex tepidarius]|uniref:Right handed beta helix domain-containing protein n=1 Tax=Sulfuracidifex tepidarius TaxID=1294262 RepID=A0A510DXJ8_9CREN|nr:hypothetical protein [Sulfuracidifex tepidarius]BBG24899.1 hypothetical protein IC006_2233 [Sulfuracidifex tepidarius]
MIVVSDHMDPDVDFYVPPGSDATDVLNEALQLGNIYGVAHIMIRGRLYLYANGNTLFSLEQSKHYLFEGDGLGELYYVNPNNAQNPGPVFAVASIATSQMQEIGDTAPVVGKQFAAYSTNGWMVAFKNLRLLNQTSQRWFIITGFSGMHSLMMYFDGVEFFSGIWINETTEVVVYNCYANGAELLFDSQSRELTVFGSRFEHNAVLAMSARGWSVVGCVFVGKGSYLNPGNDGNDGSVVACVFDGATLITQGATNLKIVASQFQNVTFSGYQGTVQLTLGWNYVIVGCSFVQFPLSITNVYNGHTIVIAMNNFDYGSYAEIGVCDSGYVDSIVIMGNIFSSQPYNSSLIFFTGSPQYRSTSNAIYFTGTINMLQIAFNTFINAANRSGATLGIKAAENENLHGQGYINLGISVKYAYISFNYFKNNQGLHDNGTGKPLGVFYMQQLGSSMPTVSYLMFYFNVNEDNPLYIPSSQSYISQFNIGM